jgi:hypothetical protein
MKEILINSRELGLQGFAQMFQNLVVPAHGRHCSKGHDTVDLLALDIAVWGRRVPREIQKPG